MKQVEIKPIKETSDDYEELVEIISDYFKEEIYLPLLKIIDAPKSVLNSREDLISAISSGRITYYRGEFKGRFSAAVTRELKKLGASWDRKHGSFRLPLSKMPAGVKRAISLSEERFAKSMKKVDDQLKKFLPEKIAERVQIHKFFDTAVFRTDEKIKETLEGISVIPKLTKAEREKIATEYTKNMDLYIQKWTKKEIVKLREEMKAHALSGSRYEDMIETIESSYGVSRNKAKFLARQETSLMMTSLKEERYKEAGSDGYIWTCVQGTANHPVRPMHKKLDGKFIRWDTPPVTDEKGNRNHAGRDYNCRCMARPIVRF
ncbi:putative head protein [Bdellovibrio phage phi1422]|uniref:head morphogenesis n=1 Tax=Bdellovibrio phage phi1422 TaxID=1127515 RepID=UPI0002536D63|nr:head morphogenesis [Bdellovibrio phage phi1422]AFC22567.1 putative head protein [Bdellovibrio phage phi1422]